MCEGFLRLTSRQVHMYPGFLHNSRHYTTVPDDTLKDNSPRQVCRNFMLVGGTYTHMYYTSLHAVITTGNFI